MNIKKIGCGLEWTSFSELKANHVVSQGWNEFGDLSFMFHNSKELWNYIELVSDWNKAGKNAFRQIMSEIKPHDIILAFEGNSVKGIAEIPEKHVYYYSHEIEHYKNCIFPVNWIDWEDFCYDKSIKGQGGQGVHGIENCNSPQLLVEYISDNWDKYKANHNVSIQLEECNQKLQALLEDLPNRQKESKKNFIELLKENKKTAMILTYKKTLLSNYNLILTGAPGTGKSYLAKQIAAQIILGKTYNEDTATPPEKDAMNKQCAFIQFHPSFDYTDFVEGLRPIDDGNGNVSFRREDGIFMSFCRNALEAYNKATDKTNAPKYVFVIDEINRGELSKIFGELFFCIDPGYRGQKGQVKTQYNNLWKNSIAPSQCTYGDSDFFYIPDNVYIIGTMNDIDRSVESMDFAMRRRFAFHEVTSEDRFCMIEENEKLADYSDEIHKRMSNLNRCILTIRGLSSAYQIGPAYFLKLEKYLDGSSDLKNSWEELWNNHIYGLLFEYLRGIRDSGEQLTKLERAFNMIDKYDIDDKDNINYREL
jgi:GTPase subunit of restriction endonuclease